MVLLTHGIQEGELVWKVDVGFEMPMGDTQEKISDTSRIIITAVGLFLVFKDKI